jgi:hypothetical protein
MKITKTKLKQLIQEELEGFNMKEEGLVDRPEVHDIPEKDHAIAKRLVVAQEQLDAAADETEDLGLKDAIRNAVDVVGNLLADLQGI